MEPGLVAQVTEYFVYLGDSPEPGKFLGQNGSSPWSGHGVARSGTPNQSGDWIEVI